jgi:putative PIN family toxin of toxin-antitoxin system
MKVVLDSNVLIAAFAARGLCEALLELCLEKHEIAASEPLLAEVREKLATKIKLPQKTIDEILVFLEEHTSSVVPADAPSDACPDPGDLMILGTAEAADASHIVTGDRDLLALDSYKGIVTATPRKFWERQLRSSTEKES